MAVAAVILSAAAAHARADLECNEWHRLYQHTDAYSPWSPGTTLKIPKLDKVGSANVQSRYHTTGFYELQVVPLTPDTEMPFGNVIDYLGSAFYRDRRHDHVQAKFVVNVWPFTINRVQTMLTNSWTAWEIGPLHPMWCWERTGGVVNASTPYKRDA